MIETTCENCQFKVMHNNSQTDCELGVLDQLTALKKPIETITIDEKEYKKFKGVCMYRRTKDWDGDINKLQTEVFIPATFIVIHTGDIKDLEKTIESIRHVKSEKPFKTIVCHDSNNIKQMRETCNGLANCSFVYMVDKLYKDIMYDEAFRRAKNGWVFFVDSGEVVPCDYLININTNKNIYLLDFVAVTGKINGYMSIIYKWLHGCKGSHIKEKLNNISANVISYEDIENNMQYLPQKANR